MRSPKNPMTQLHRFLKDGIYHALSNSKPIHFGSGTASDPIDLTTPPPSPTPGQGSLKGVDRSTGIIQSQAITSDAGHQLVLDVSSQQHSKGDSEGEIAFCPTDSNQRLHDSPGAAPRRRSTSPHRPLATQEGNRTPS